MRIRIQIFIQGIQKGGANVDPDPKRCLKQLIRYSKHFLQKVISFSMREQYGTAIFTDQGGQVAWMSF